VIVGLKPQAWEGACRVIASHLKPTAVIVSIMAGVSGAHLQAVFGDRPLVRVMPTTAAAVGKGAASVWAADGAARAAAHALFAPLGVVVDLTDEGQMHAATAASGSAPAYAYALVECLEAAGRRAGLEEGAARSLSRAALIGAAALMETSGEEAATLRAQVTSPKGTTEAALAVLLGDGGLASLVTRAVLAAATRSRELGGET
jgi:pyrroline-5-carboxylate reductase